MNRRFNLFVATLCILCAPISPAWADANTASSSPPSNSTPSNASPLRTGPVAVAGICAGFLVGMPICYARKLPEEAKNGAEGLAGSFFESGETKNKLILIPAGVFWLPVSAMTTLMETPVYSFRNAWRADKPFSKEQFSLGEMDAPAKK